VFIRRFVSFNRIFHFNEVQSALCQENRSAINSIKQLPPLGWPENDVTTFGPDAKINTAGSTTCGEFADSCD